MPKTAIRPEIVALLLDADFKVRPDTNTWSHRDGRPFTQDEQATALDATYAELEAVSAESTRQVAAAREQDEAVEALTDLLLSYFSRHPGVHVVGDLLPHMTPEDHAEYERLCAIAAPGGGFFLPYED
ncbi:hypothetical protein [Streptomyces fradiae]|uniref:hypothetical protein n=1 Tax=Streptomyces fradiae TaxID=1906 RepID=UPI0039876C07